MGGIIKGTLAGDLSEVELVKLFNSDKNSIKFSNYMKVLVPDKSYDNVFMVRVTTKQHSRLSNSKVMTRADAYLIKIEDKDLDQLLKILEKTENYLEEKTIEELNFIKIKKSGISVKRIDSKKYQILKLTPVSFNKLFNCFELGAGASLFCKRENELEKNIKLLNGWHTDINLFSTYFSEFQIGKDSLTSDKQLCTDIKNYSLNKIKEIIIKDKEKSMKIFNGIGWYEEPYTAYYFYQGTNISRLDYIPFNVTTGSGRSKQKYTLVLKPK